MRGSVARTTQRVSLPDGPTPDQSGTVRCRGATPPGRRQTPMPRPSYAAGHRRRTARPGPAAAGSSSARWPRRSCALVAGWASYPTFGVRRDRRGMVADRTRRRPGTPWSGRHRAAQIACAGGAQPLDRMGESEGDRSRAACMTKSDGVDDALEPTRPHHGEQHVPGLGPRLASGADAARASGTGAKCAARQSPPVRVAVPRDRGAGCRSGWCTSRVLQVRCCGDEGLGLKPPVSR